MDQQEILRKIGGIMVELKDQHAYLEANGSSFNELELELFMANANFLADHIEILKKIHGKANPTAATASKLEKVYPTKPVVLDYFSEEAALPVADDLLLKKFDIPATIEIEPVQAQLPAQEEIFALPEAVAEEKPGAIMVADTSFIPLNLVLTEKKEAVENVFEDAEAGPVITIESKPETQYLQENPKTELVFTEELKPEPAKPEPVKQTIINLEPVQQDFIKPEPVKPEPEPVLTLNQRIAAQKSLEQPTVKAGFAGKPIQDLPSLISLNDKLLFVKELFNGYNLAYSEAINILNRYTNLEQSEQFLKVNYAEKNNWKDKPATAERFYDVLKKRFS